MTQNIKIKFEPIVSLDEMRVVGFQILSDDKEIFIYHEDQSNEWARLIGLYQQIFQQCLQDPIFLVNQSMLYIPVDANALVVDFGEIFLEELLAFHKRGMPFDKMVIQIKEEMFTGDVENLYYLIRYYRTYGILFAIDHHDMGKSNIETIRLLRPDILKINLSNQKIQAYPLESQDLLSILSLLMRKIGTTILFDQICSDIHLYNAWKNNGRYLSGDYIFPAVDKMADAQKSLDYIQKDLADFVFRENKRLSQVYAMNQIFNEKCKRIFSHRYQTREFDAWFELLLNVFKDCVYRMYFVNGNGVQISGNYVTKSEGKWEKADRYIGRNWSFRPYFLESIAKLKYEKRGNLSDIYADLKSKNFIRTFSYPIDDEAFLFMDLNLEYLYENDLLL